MSDFNFLRPYDSIPLSRASSNTSIFSDSSIPSVETESSAADTVNPNPTPPFNLASIISHPRVIVPDPNAPSFSSPNKVTRGIVSHPTEQTRQYDPARKDDSSSSSPDEVTTVVAPAVVAAVRKSKANELLDREERAIAALLTRFKNLVLLAALPTEDAFSKETAAAEALRMEVESNALVSASEDLLKLTRELKELWINGPLRGIGEGEGEGEMEANSKKVAELIEKQLEKKHEREKNGA